MPLILPPPQQNPGIAGQIGQNILAFLQTKMQMDERNRLRQQQAEELKMKKEEAALQAKIHGFSLKKLEQEGAKQQYEMLAGTPAPVGDVSNGVSGIQGGGQSNPLAAIGGGGGMADILAPYLNQQRQPVPMPPAQVQPTPRVDMSGAQPVGQHPLIPIPSVTPGGADVMVRPPTQEQVLSSELSKRQATAQIDLRSAFEKARAEATGRNMAPPAPMTEYQRAQVNSPTTAKLAFAAAQGDKDAATAMGLIKASSGGGRSNEAVTLTPEGEAMAALQFIKTGKLPPLGFDAKTKTKIINRAATLTPDEVQSLEQSGLDLAGNSMDFAADKGSLTTLQRTRDAVTAFEKTAIRNIDIFLGTAKNAVDTGSPLVNQPVRAIAGTLLGSKNLAEFNAARQVALTEAAKVLNNPNLSGVLSDSARKEVEGLLSPNATLGQAYAVFNLLKNEMKGRTQYLDQTIAEIKGRGKTGTTTKSGFTIVEVK